ncbi:hypothetical protein O9992_30770 [Vibrio lentus]|nr:hypothetical protein [Vibrio lentus]
MIHLVIEIGIVRTTRFFLPTLHVIKSEPLLYSIVNKAIENISAGRTPKDIGEVGSAKSDRKSRL